MASRYENRLISKNSEKVYKELLDKRGVGAISQYRTPKLKHITASDISKLQTVGHIWKTGDRFFKLAHKHYGDSELWWVIAWFNQTPTEGHLKLGEVIQIPLPLERVLSYFEI